MDIPLPVMELEESSLLDGAGEEPKIVPHDLLINVLGASFSITAGEEPAYLDEVLAQYQIAVANTQGISGMKDPLKVAILTGFLLCDEINKLKLQVEKEQSQADLKQYAESQELNRLIGNILSRIDKAVNG